MNDNEQALVHLTPGDALNLVLGHALALGNGPRVAIGIAGGPGVGKSTLAVKLVEALNRGRQRFAAYVPMDGFHMKHNRLEMLGTVHEKGMPHTFEGAVFADFLERLKSATDPVSVPGYSRKFEDVVDDAFIVEDDVRIIVTEGNYLLLATAPWWRVRPLLDLAIFLEVPRDLVRARLLRRHAEEGLFTEERNREHVDRVDLANYDLVMRSRSRADIVIKLITES